MKLFKGVLALGIALSMLSISGHAQEKKALLDQVSGAGYGTAGCGLGSIIFGAKPGKVQIFASTTNGLYGNQTFGITSGTSNCDIAEMGQQAATFIEVNKEVVRKEAAMGQGESVDAIAMLLNCEKVDMTTEIKGNYDYYLGQEVSSYETVRRLMNSNSCQQEI